MSKFESIVEEAQEILLFAFDELKEAKKEQDEMTARQAAEKGYLALVKAFNALFVKKGKKIEELPLSERGRRFFIHKLAGRKEEKFYDSMRHSLHIDGFHEGIIMFDSLEDDLNDIERFILGLENGNEGV
ncbi:MAG: PaREP1 family protein [bacterium]